MMWAHECGLSWALGVHLISSGVLSHRVLGTKWSGTVQWLWASSHWRTWPWWVWECWGGGSIICCEVPGGVEATFEGSSHLIMVVEGVEGVVSRVIIEAVLTARGLFWEFQVVYWGMCQAI